MKDMNLFKYHPNDTFFHNRDPRANIIFALTISTLGFFIDPVFLILLIILVLILFFVSKIESQIPILAKYSVISGLMIILLNAYVRKEDLFFKFYFISLSKSGAFFGGIMALRLMVLIFVFSWFSSVTHPKKLISIFHKFPLLAFIMNTSIRFVPMIVEDYKRIRNAQMSRCLEFGGGGKKKIKNIIPIAIPLFVITIRRAMRIAEGIETRGFRLEGRTYYYNPKLDFFDVLMIIISFTVILATLGSFGCYS
ncbi:MAG TPA: energy-coupling factor transporter transmembrane protein EcfT [Methanosarcinales archaeon]|nr:energy-coupling factor transporter transmembrane protein EcfT [Methanosarcinales archaeon]